ncbi:MAG TPA: bifunctional glutamate N-acetyltransferase/amino-acid acetyltransferase ArgJ [Polyangiaceae bacterium]
MRGFRFGAAQAGLKRVGLDLGLVVADAPAPAVAMFTRNLVRAAPVEVGIDRVRRGTVQAVLVNSGNANACTGEPGLEATLRSTTLVAEALGIDARLVFPASTGVIGRPLPVDRIAQALPALVNSLSEEGAGAFASAIMTTDRFEKIATARVDTGEGDAHVLGIAKGAGMIHPDLAGADAALPHATMLAFLFTDLVAEPEELRAALESAVDTSFNACTVDGDTSTNDTALLLASGASRCRAAPAALAAALGEVCRELAIKMVEDGEGAEHAIEIRVSGLASREEARTVARTVASSLLVKTAFYGKDANWGRLLAAAGRAGVRFDPRAAQIAIGGVAIVRGGVALGEEAEVEASKVLAEPRFAVDLVLGGGPGAFSYFTSDLGHGYVDVNAGYRT